jgi:hypothetical protein
MALAACTMDRSALSSVLGAADEHDCCDTDMSATACVTLTTADLQVPSALLHIGVLPCDGPVLLLPISSGKASASLGDMTPPASIPRRILLHSFLI